MAVGLQVWASGAQADPGYFARTTAFLHAVLLAGVWLLTTALFANTLLAWSTANAREAAKETTLKYMLRVDGALARKLAASNPGRDEPERD